MTLAPQFDLPLFPWHHAQRPDLAGVLSLYRTEREQPGTLTIRTGGNGKGA